MRRNEWKQSKYPFVMHWSITEGPLAPLSGKCPVMGWVDWYSGINRHGTMKVIYAMSR